MKQKLTILFVLAAVAVLPIRAFAQSCTSTDLAGLGACAYEAAQECRAQYPGCTTTNKKLTPVITQQDVLNVIVGQCCTSGKTTQQQNRCLKAKVNAQVLRYNLLKAVAATSFKPAIQAAIRNLQELKREGCAAGSIVD